MMKNLKPIPILFSIYAISILFTPSYSDAETLRWSCKSNQQRLFNSDFNVEYSRSRVSDVFLASSRSSQIQKLGEDDYLFSTQQTLFCSVMQFASQDYIFLIRISEPTFPARPTQSQAEIFLAISPDPKYSCITMAYLIDNQLAQVDLTGSMDCQLDLIN